MKRWQRELIRIVILAILFAFSWWLYGCAELYTPQGQATIATAEQIANIAGSAAATTYAGPVAGQMASAGLSALGSVLNGYIGSHAPASVVKASPGVAGVGAAVAPLLTNKTITTAEINAVNEAAAILAKK